MSIKLIVFVSLLILPIPLKIFAHYSNVFELMLHQSFIPLQINCLLVIFYCIVWIIFMSNTETRNIITNVFPNETNNNKIKHIERKWNRNDVLLQYHCFVITFCDFYFIWLFSQLSSKLCIYKLFCLNVYYNDDCNTYNSFSILSLLFFDTIRFIAMNALFIKSISPISFGSNCIFMFSASASVSCRPAAARLWDFIWF